MPEAEYRQAIYDIDRIYYRPGKFRKKRPRLERFLDHPDERVRAYVQGVLQPPDWLLEIWREEAEREEEMAAMAEQRADSAGDESWAAGDPARSDEEIPF
jgi:hypothetical protein